MNLEELFYEAKQRINWYIDGIGIHCLSWDSFNRLSTERIVEIYNVDMSYFKMKNK